MKVVADPIKGNTFSDFMPPEVLVLPPGFGLRMDTYPAKTWTVVPQEQDHKGALGTPEAAPWNGEGLPPIGTVCEYKWRDEWHQVTVVAIVRGPFDCHPVIVQMADDWNYEDDPSRFRPIRTAEQIAAVKRKKAIGEMIDIYKSNYEGLVADGCQALYDSGYRKQEQSK